MDDFYSRLEACAEVLALIVQRATTLDETAALDVAKSIDRMIKFRRRRTAQPEKAGTAWLVQVRDGLLSWHKLRPEVMRAIAEGRIQINPTNRLRLVEDTAPTETLTKALPKNRSR